MKTDKNELKKTILKLSSQMPDYLLEHYLSDLGKIFAGKCTENEKNTLYN